MPNTAQIKIDVTSFAANPSLPTPGVSPPAPHCAINGPTLQEGPGNSGLSNADGQVSIDSDGTIVVIRRGPGNAPIKLQFTISGPAGAALRPTDIVFVQSRGTGDSDGSVNFPNAGRTMGGSSITIDNHCVTRGPRQTAAGTNLAAKWKYFIRVQQGTAFGWIDPGIENADEM